jgi:hypothetical protein
MNGRLIKPTKWRAGDLQDSPIKIKLTGTKNPMSGETENPWADGVLDVDVHGDGLIVKAHVAVGGFPVKVWYFTQRQYDRFAFDGSGCFILC